MYEATYLKLSKVENSPKYAMIADAVLLPTPGMEVNLP